MMLSYACGKAEVSKMIIKFKTLTIFSRRLPLRRGRLFKSSKELLVFFPVEKAC